MTNLDSVLKSRDITLPTKVCIVKAMVFPVVMYRCESWTTKKAEHWRIDAFKEWCWRRHLRVPWTARRSNQSINGNQLWIFTGMTDAEAEAPILPSPDVKSRLTEKDSDAGKHRGRRRGWQRMAEVGWHHWLNGHEFELTPGDREGQGSLACCSPWVAKSRTRLRD